MTERPLGGSSIKLPLHLLAVVALVATGCGGAAGASSSRSVRIDYNHDQFAGSLLAYFPNSVQVHPGDTVVFRQDWTGEAHSVTMGTLVDRAMRVVIPLTEKYPDFDDQPTPEDEAAYNEAMKDLPTLVGEEFDVHQNGAQPCYLDEGAPPQDPNTPCDKQNQRQPAFNGRQSYYNSGFIPYQGTQGNRFEVRLASDIAPGTYNYYCNLHGPGMRGTIAVVPPQVAIPSEEEVARQARQEIDAIAEPLLKAVRQARESDEIESQGKVFRRPFAGFGSDEVKTPAFISEFFPNPIETRVGEKVTWTFIGPHTVSFNVPEYFAQFTVETDGTVVSRPEAVQPVNSPPLPKSGPTPSEEPKASEKATSPAKASEKAAEKTGGPSEQASEAPSGPPPPPDIDGGEWDGTTFKSSGLMGEGRYSLTFTRPGTYNYACLVHPRMVGKVIVR